MSSNKLLIAGFPHLAVAAQSDEGVRKRMLAELKAAGFKIEPHRLVPPDGANGTAIMSAISAAFQNAKTGSSGTTVLQQGAGDSRASLL